MPDYASGPECALARRRRSAARTSFACRCPILHAREDRRVPVCQSQRFADALRASACEVELIVYERDSHLLLLRRARRRRQRLRALARPEGAAPLLEQAVAWAQPAGHPDRGFHQELAAAYVDPGRAEDAAEQERLSTLAGPGPFSVWQSRPRPRRSDPGS